MVDMYGSDCFRIQPAQISCHVGAPITPLRYIAIVAKFEHDLVHCLRIFLVVKASLFGTGRETVPWERWSDHMESGIIQPGEDLRNLQEGSRPAVYEQERYCAWA